MDVLGNEVNVFYYGNYGGPSYPDPSELITKKNGDPLSQKGITAADTEDYFFYVHDVESFQASTVEEQALADINLINSLTNNDASYSSDPEAVLYDAIATFGMIGSLILSDSLDLISPTLLLNALTDAVDDLLAGIEGLAEDNPLELAAILVGLFDEPLGSSELTFDFTFPDLGPNPELTEIPGRQLRRRCDQ